MTQSNLLIYGGAALAFIAILCLGFLFTSSEADSAARKRVKTLSKGDTNGNGKAKPGDEINLRRRETQKLLAKLKDEEGVKRTDILPQDTASKIARAGLSISPSMFWICSAITGLFCALLVFMTGLDNLFIIKSRTLMAGLAGLAGGLGLPRWVLGFLEKRRKHRITLQFVDAIDVIVRGVKSGLALNECLRMIARESPAPLGPEFVTLTDNLSMGMESERALQTFYKRLPLPEINFFVIVLTIQIKSGGNLSEALGNLSSVIRQRRLMREKVKAMSSEAKASAMIIGVLPIAVAIMVYFTTPDYIMLLFTTDTGHLFLLIAATLMTTGIMIMRKMINFDM